MLVFDDYKRQPGSNKNADGSPTTLVDIQRVTFLMFPTPPRDGLMPPRDAIIVEAPLGAHLEFDEFRPESGKIGQILRGEFPGAIRIHSDMKDPGPEDDLLVEVSDLAMNTKLLYTSQPNSPVRFRMGESVGGGTELEIRFLADEHYKPSDAGLKIAGFDSLEIRRDVKMRLQMDSGALMLGAKKKNAKPKDKNGQPLAIAPTVQLADASTVKAAPAKPPVDVSCSGPFTFDFVRYVASLDHDVELVQANPNGPSNQLSCTRLDIHFAPKPQTNPAGQAAIGDPGKRQQRELGQLEAVAIVAEGHPAVMTSPSRNAQARGDRIQIALRDQRLRISGGNDAMFVEGTNVLQAPVIDYQHPMPEEATAIGRFRATGPGTLHYVTDPTKPQQVLNAEWQTSVQLGRDKGQPVLALDGRPKVTFADTGTLSADQIRLYLRELDSKSSAGITLGGGDAQSKLRLAPDRMLATGHVEIASPQFTGRAQSLSATFRLQAPAADGAQTESATSTSAPSSKPNNETPATVAPSTAQPQQKYYIDTDQMELEVSMLGQSAAPVSLACDGHVVVREIPLVATAQQPLEIRGGQLLVTELNTKTPHATLHGDAPGQPAGSALAQLVGRGVTMLVGTVELDQHENRLWSDGPGKATILTRQGITGTPSATPVPVDLTWQGGLKFDGQTVLFERDVAVNATDSKVHCDQLVAKLNAPIHFGERAEQSNIALNEIECRGQVALENVQRDPGGVTSHEVMQLARLTINQQTGAMSGDGPGVIRATRFGDGMVTIPGQPAPQKTASTNAAGNKLYFLRVDFRKGLEGNMYIREVTFHERVRAIYGPVDSWEQELDPTRPATLPSDTVTLTSDDLRVNEDTVAARAAPPTAAGKRQMGPLQMQAKGDVRIDGKVPNQGEFSVQADRASYEQAKDAFILEGDTRTPAKLWRRSTTGTDSPPTEARKIRYVRSTGETKVEGIQYFEVVPGDLQSARRPTPIK
jgi:lipopolysaccharide export system protein LptA